MTTENQTLDQAAADKAMRRIKTLLAEGCTHQEICDTLNSEGYLTIKHRLWNRNNLTVLLYRLRHKWASFYAVSQRRAGLELA